MNLFKSSFFWMALVVGSFSFCDDHVTFKTHTQEYEFMGQKQPATDAETHLWISDTKAMMGNDLQESIIDLDKKLAYLVMLPEKFYVEMALPVSLKSVLPEPMLAMMDQIKTRVTVAESDETRKILEIPCKTYSITFDNGFSKVVTKTFVSDQVPFDYAAYQKNFEESFNRIQIQMLDDEGFSELSKVKGFQMGFEMSVEMMGTTVISSTEVVSFDSSVPPEGAYLPPLDFEKLEKLPLPQGPQ